MAENFADLAGDMKLLMEVSDQTQQDTLEETTVEAHLSPTSH